MKKIGSGKTSHTANKIIQDMWDSFYAFDYNRFYKIKSVADMRNPEISRTVERIESHPSWNKSYDKHASITKEREIKERERYQKEMEFDALRGLHHKHANVFFGKIIFDSEYKQVCERLGISPILRS